MKKPMEMLMMKGSHMLKEGREKTKKK